MLIARTLEDLARARAKLAGSPTATLALVPTMGALHAGHASLLRAARAQSDIVAASIFVNPTQFDNPEDLARYPRDMEADLAALRDAGCDLAWTPTVEIMYADENSVRVMLDGPARGWEADFRPGHFTGVATVVVKLINQLGPARAYFGEKDWQQLQAIRSVVAALFIPVTIEAVATMRDPDGLAMSSRNRRLGREDRERAPALYRGLLRAARAIVEGDAVPAVLETAREDLALRGFKVDYLALISGSGMHPISTLAPDARLIAAARLGGVRLLDNIAIEPPASTDRPNREAPR